MDAQLLSLIINFLSTRTFWLVSLFAILVITFWRDPRLDWVDMITTVSHREGYEKQVVSLSKVGQAVGIVISSWVVINLSEHDKLSFDIFYGWLAFLLGGAGWSAWLKTKSPIPGTKPATPVGPAKADDDDEDVPPPPKK
jgi:hypothetical protein